VHRCLAAFVIGGEKKGCGDRSEPSLRPDQCHELASPTPAADRLPGRPVRAGHRPWAAEPPRGGASRFAHALADGGPPADVSPPAHSDCCHRDAEVAVGNGDGGDPRRRDAGGGFLAAAATSDGHGARHGHRHATAGGHGLAPAAHRDRAPRHGHQRAHRPWPAPHQPGVHRSAPGDPAHAASPAGCERPRVAGHEVHGLRPLLRRRRCVHCRRLPVAPVAVRDHLALAQWPPRGHH
jgi:hypothetical protein